MTSPAPKIPDYVELAHISDTDIEPGLYLTMPQGHALLAGAVRHSADGPTVHRRLTVLDMGGVIQIGGLDITDPDVLEQFADHLRMLSLRLAREQAHPYRPGTPEARRRDEAARAGQMWDRNSRPLSPGQLVDVYAPSGDYYLGRTRVERVDRTAGVLFVETTLILGDTVETLSAPVVFPEDAEVVDE